ncbi:18840_t:CDS:2 [Acaulospora morrowiae]|uniref:18840_t:CDS:1 n=1 Tax=Acaulospora morrowiae TaxID=94023 RepID=A0A9N8VZE8_9GLOM|nr:18840_t:CDS:2 [Acaulospora morrowiae]
MPLTSKYLSQMPTADNSVSFSILPSPFQTVLHINNTQLQQAFQRVGEIDTDVRNSAVNRTLITNITKQQKSEYSSIIADLIPLYAKINRLIPLHYIITKNSDTAARNFITMVTKKQQYCIGDKYLIQQQFISLPEERYFLTIEELQKHKELLQELEKCECAVEKLQNSGGLASINILFDTKKVFDSETLDQIRQDDATSHQFSSPPLKYGAGTLAKFLSLVKDDSLDDLTSRVGDIILPKKNVNDPLAKGLNRSQI